MRIPAKEKLRKFYDCFKREDQVLVMINADPDAISSAMAVKRLLWRKTSGVYICSISKIKRPDNLTMVEALGVKIMKPDEAGKKHFTKFVIVDSQPEHNELFQKYDYDVIIDHHPICKASAGFVDIRPDYGATASIMTEYIKSYGIKPSMTLATGLLIGIKTDTGGFTRHSLEADFKAFRFVYKYASKHLVHRIEHAEIRQGDLKYFQKAIEIRKIVRGRLFAHLGNVSSPDICVIIADFFMRVTKIKWSIVSGIFGEKMVVIFRSDGVRKNCGKLAAEAFGTIGSAGGHKTMARAEIPLAVLTAFVDIENEKKTSHWLRMKIIKGKM